MPQYDALYEKGSCVRVADIETLGRFAEQWKLHNPLRPQMIAHAGGADPWQSRQQFDGKSAGDIYT